MVFSTEKEVKRKKNNKIITTDLYKTEIWRTRTRLDVGAI